MKFFNIIPKLFKKEDRTSQEVNMIEEIKEVDPEREILLQEIINNIQSPYMTKPKPKAVQMTAQEWGELYNKNPKAYQQQLNTYINFHRTKRDD